MRDFKIRWSFMNLGKETSFLQFEAYDIEHTHTNKRHVLVHGIQNVIINYRIFFEYTMFEVSFRSVSWY